MMFIEITQSDIDNSDEYKSPVQLAFEREYPRQRVITGYTQRGNFIGERKLSLGRALCNIHRQWALEMEIQPGHYEYNITS
jgi:hypothetical protein